MISPVARRLRFGTDTITDVSEPHFSHLIVNLWFFITTSKRSSPRIVTNDTGAGGFVKSLTVTDFRAFKHVSATPCHFQIFHKFIITYLIQTEMHRTLHVLFLLHTFALLLLYDLRTQKKRVVHSWQPKDGACKLLDISYYYA